MVKHAKYLSERYEEVPPAQFYREIFGSGNLEERGVQQRGKYCGIAVELYGEKKGNRYQITDDLEVLDKLREESPFFTMLAPISYAGKFRTAANERFLFALVVELDNLLDESNGGSENQGINQLVYEFSERARVNDAWHLPKPTYIVCSGNGVHLYYKFVEPLPLWRDTVESLSAYKHDLTHFLWNGYTCRMKRDGSDVQYEPIHQAFRMVGGLTKEGVRLGAGALDRENRVRAFRFGEPVTVEYMNDVPYIENKIRTVYQSSLSFEKARKRFPNWATRIEYERQHGLPHERGRWVCKRDLYEWWLRKIPEIAHVGNRYNCLFVLGAYAIKCNVPSEQLKEDMLSLVPSLDEKGDGTPKEAFTRNDALAAYTVILNDGYVKLSIEAIEAKTGVRIERNKRNWRPRQEHIKIMNFVRDEINKNTAWRNKDGRPTAEATVREWRAAHPGGRKIDCQRQTGLSRPTVLKWWQTP